MCEIFSTIFNECLPACFEQLRISVQNCQCLNFNCFIHNQQPEIPLLRENESAKQNKTNYFHHSVFVDNLSKFETNQNEIFFSKKIDGNFFYWRFILKSSESHIGAYLQMIRGPPGYYKVKILLNARFGLDSKASQARKINWNETKYFTPLDCNGQHKFINKETFNSVNFVNEDRLQVDLSISVPNVDDYQLICDNYVLKSDLEFGRKKLKHKIFMVQMDELVKLDKIIYSENFYSEFQCWRLKIFHSREYVSVFIELLAGAYNSYWINVKLIRQIRDNFDKTSKKHEKIDKISTNCFKFNQTMFLQGWAEFIRIDELQPFIDKNGFLVFHFAAGLKMDEKNDILINNSDYFKQILDPNIMTILKKIDVEELEKREFHHRLKDDKKQFNIYLELQEGVLSFRIKHHSGLCSQIELTFEILHQKPFKTFFQRNIYDFSQNKEYELSNLTTLEKLKIDGFLEKSEYFLLRIKIMPILISESLTKEFPFTSKQTEMNIFSESGPFLSESLKDFYGNWRLIVNWSNFNSQTSIIGVFLQMLDGAPGLYQYVIRVFYEGSRCVKKLNKKNIFFDILDVDGEPNFRSFFEFRKFNKNLPVLFEFSVRPMQIQWTENYLKIPHQLTIEHDKQLVNGRYDRFRIFKIRNFSKIKHIKEILFSESFHGKEGFTWKLVIHPNGVDIAKGSFISVFIEMIKGPPNGMFKFCVKLLKKKGSDESFSKESQGSLFETNKCKKGWTKFICNSDSALRPYLMDNTLTFKYSVWIVEKSQTEKYVAEFVKCFIETPIFIEIIELTKSTDFGKSFSIQGYNFIIKTAFYQNGTNLGLNFTLADGQILRFHIHVQLIHPESNKIWQIKNIVSFKAQQENIIWPTLIDFDSLKVLHQRCFLFDNTSNESLMFRISVKL